MNAQLPHFLTIQPLVSRPPGGKQAQEERGLAPGVQGGLRQQEG